MTTLSLKDIKKIVKQAITDNMSSYDISSFTDMSSVKNSILDNWNDYISYCKIYISRRYTDFSFEEFKIDRPRDYRYFIHQVEIELIHWYNYFKENCSFKDIFD